MTTGDRQRLGARLREAREHLNLSQGSVAESIGMARTALVLVELGKRRVDALELKKLAKIYDRPISYFVGEDAPGARISGDAKRVIQITSRLSSRELAEVLQFADFIHSRKKSKRGAV